MWDLEVGKKTKEVEAAHAGDVVSLSLAPDKSCFVTGSVDRTCKLWDLNELKCKQIFFGHEADVNSVCVRFLIFYSIYTSIHLCRTCLVNAVNGTEFIALKYV